MVNDVHSDYIKMCRICKEAIVFHGNKDVDNIPLTCRCNCIEPQLFWNVKCPSICSSIIYGGNDETK